MYISAAGRGKAAAEVGHFYFLAQRARSSQRARRKGKGAFHGEFQYGALAADRRRIILALRERNLQVKLRQQQDKHCGTSKQRILRALRVLCDLCVQYLM